MDCSQIARNSAGYLALLFRIRQLAGMTDRGHVWHAVLGGLCAGIAAAAMPAVARTEPEEAGSYFQRGRCFKLILAGNDLTARCRNRVTSLVLADGTLAFVFSTRDITVVFSGDREGVVRNRDAAHLPVEVVAIGEDEQTLEATGASGTCRFGDPYSGPTAIECSAESVFGSMKAGFISNGKPPRPS